MLLIQNGYIKTMAGADIENGAVLIDDNGRSPPSAPTLSRLQGRA